MTKKQAIWFLAIGVVVAVTLIAAHLALPIRETWAVNRVLHHVWEGVTGLAAVGGIVWLLWPRTKAQRRDEQRRRTRRRLVVLVGTILAAVILVVFAEMHREMASRSRLSGRAVEDLETFAKALEAYAGDHEGKRPESAADLVPTYLPGQRLYYVYRFGPAETAPPAAATGQDTEQPSYALVWQRPLPPGAGPKSRPEPRLLAYLRPGNAWAPLTAVLRRDGHARVAGEDEVQTFEKQNIEEP